VKKRDAIFLWVLFGWLAFALLPSWSLDYGLLESTRDEILAAYGWSQFNISWLWDFPPNLLLIRERPAGPPPPATTSTPAGHFYVWRLLSSAPPWKAVG